MRLLKIHILAAAVILIHMSAVLASNNCTPSVSNDAWKFLETFKHGYAKYVTVDMHKICIIFEETQADATAKKAIYNVSSISTDNGQANPTTNEVFQVQECPSDMEVHLQSDGQYLYNVTIKYSDYATCTILHHHDATHACSMFLTQEANSDKEACLTQFVKYCGNVYYDIYYESICNRT
ncbi:uncharacterized protein LOC115313416 [Ixodes scapularis]|uniref:uncharacterized protein LOC115313416 n=1 Tax=Ixodes scapularis TaxID=6945 RepID=UPI001A9EFA03|nr:uncharacterized protein LOC115313416 [Ixodes scapularis]